MVSRQAERLQGHHLEVRWHQARFVLVIIMTSRSLRTIDVHAFWCRCHTIDAVVRAGSSATSSEFVLGLQNQLKEANVQMEGLEKERDFYFAKVNSLIPNEGLRLM